MCWRLLLLPFLFVRGMLSRVGNTLDIKTGVTLIIFLRLAISGFVQPSESGPLATIELKSIATHSTVVTQNVDLAEHIFWQSRKLDSKDLGTCPCSIPGFIPALSKWGLTSNGFFVVSLSSGIQWILVEEQKVLMFDYEDSNRSKLFSNIVNLNNVWSLLALLVLLLDMMIWHKPDIVIGFVVISLLGIDIPGIVGSGSRFEFPVLMFLIAYFLVFFSLILACMQNRERLSRFTAGVAYTSATLGFLGNIVIPLPLEYSARTCVPILLVIFVLFVIHGYIPDGAI